MNSDKIRVLIKFLEEDPSDAFTMYALALEFVKAGQHQSADETFDMLIKMEPGYLAAFYQYGKLCEMMDKKEKAIELYKQGMKLAKERNNTKTFNEIKEAFDMLVEDFSPGS